MRINTELTRIRAQFELNSKLFSNKKDVKTGYFRWQHEFAPKYATIANTSSCKRILIIQKEKVKLVPHCSFAKILWD